MFKKGQRVEMTVLGLERIRLRNGHIRKHRHGVQMAATGVVVTTSRKNNQVAVRLDSMPANSSPDYYSVEYWQLESGVTAVCFACEAKPSVTEKVLARGPREGQRVSLCDECLDDFKTRLIVSEQ